MLDFIGLTVIAYGVGNVLLRGLIERKDMDRSARNPVERRNPV